MLPLSTYIFADNYLLLISTDRSPSSFVFGEMDARLGENLIKRSVFIRVVCKKMLH